MVTSEEGEILNALSGRRGSHGHALGRFWNVGPQQTLYVPAPLLGKGSNEIVIFTLERHRLGLWGLREPIVNDLGRE